MKAEPGTYRQWCVFLCDTDFHVMRIISQEHLSFSLRPGDSLAQLMAPESLERFFTFAREMHTRKAVFFHELLITDHSGTPVILDFSCIRYNDALLVAATSRGMELHEELLVINHELTNTLRSKMKASTEPSNYLEQMSSLNNELINMKRELMKKNAAITQLLEKQEALNGQLQELIDTRDLLFSIIAHDLRSPLSNIMSLMNLIAIDEDAYDDALKEGVFQSVHQSAAKTMGFLEDLLQWYRYSQNNDLMMPQMSDAHLLGEEAISHFQTEAERKQIRLTVLGSSTPVFADSQMIAAALRNLVSNAIKYTGPGGSVSMEISGHENDCRFCVRDTGIGIPSHQLNTLFYIRENKSTPGLSGEKVTGFGLVLTRLMVEKNGGTLTAESEPSQGTCVCITLPAAKKEAP